MKSKWKKVVKEYWVIPVSLLLLYPAAVMAALFGYGIVGVTGIAGLYYVAYIVAGGLASLLITIKIGKLQTLNKATKVVIIAVIVLLFSVISYKIVG